MIRSESEPWLVPIRIARPSSLQRRTTGLKRSGWRGASMATARSASDSIFTRDLLDRNQLKFYGFAIVAIILATNLGFMQRIFGTADLTFDQWLTCVVVAFSVVIVEEIIKIFVRRSQKGAAKDEVHAPASPAGASIG